MAEEIVVNLLAGTPRQLWCDDCLTSARYEVDLFTLSSDGLQLFGVAHGCDRCKTGASAPQPPDTEP